MATKNVDIGINVSDKGGFKKLIKDVNELHSAVKATQKSAENLSAPKAGYRAAAAAKGTDAQLSNQEYNRGRGSMGTTGASARDFANQAQGLGGLVRLYATYAANIFAVGAAFRALSSAMDTTNLVRGLDQLGASSGTALGSLSKRLVAATDGAISLREAMTSTAKASSSGMSSENILRMGKVAKQASQALGVDMADAVNRLTRGITKLEPELLDELGIFTKVDKATEDYAKSLGRTTASITDFEKRMAFANAVLTEGEKKFSAIDFDTNAYTRLSATLSDVSQTGLDLVNKVLGPIVKFLSENPKTLALAIGALGVALVKQALPALGQFKAGLAASAAEATQLAKTKAADAASANDRLNEALIAQRTTFAQAQITKLNIAAEQLEAARVKKASSAVKLLEKDFATLDAGNVKAIEQSIKRVNSEADVYLKKAQAAEAAGKDPRAVQALYDKAEAYKNAAYAAQSSLSAEQKYAAEEARTKKANIFVAYQQMAAESAITASKKQAIIANAAYNASLIGPIKALKLMREELKVSGLELGTFSKGMLYARAGFTSFASAAGTLLSTLGGAMQVFAILAAAVSAAIAIFSNNQKELSGFGQAVDAAESSIANLNRTIDTIKAKPFGEQLSTESLKATATAVSEVSASVLGLVTSFNRAEAAQNGFDRFLNSIKSIWGGDLKSTFAKSLGSTLFDALTSVADSPEIEEAKQKLSSILNLKGWTSKEMWQEAVEGISDNKSKLRELILAYEEFKVTQAKVAGVADQFDSALAKSLLILRDFTNEYAIKDNLSNLAISMVATGEAAAAAFEKPESAIARLKSLIDDPKKFQLLGTEDLQNLIKYNDQIVNLNRSFEKQDSNVKSARESLNQLKAELSSRVDEKGNALGGEASQSYTNKLKADIRQQEENLRTQEAALNATRSDIVEMTQKFPNLAANQFTRGADLVSIGIQAAFAKGSTNFSNAVLNSVGDLPGTAQRRYEIENRKLESEKRLLDQQALMISATMQNTMALDNLRAAENVSIAQSDVRESRGQDPEALKRLEQARKAVKDLEQKENIINIDPTKALDAIEVVKQAAKDGNTEVAKSASAILTYFQQLSGIALQKRNVEDQQRANQYNKQLGEITERMGEENRITELKKEQNSLQLAELAISKARNGGLTEAELSLEQQANTEALILDTKTKNRIIAAEIEKTYAAINTKQVDEAKGIERITQLEQQVINNLRKQRNDIENVSIQAVKNRLELKKQEFDQQEKINEAIKAGVLAGKEAENKRLNIANTAAQQSETFTPEFQAQRSADVASINVRYQQEIDLINLRDEQRVKSFALSEEIELLETLATTEEGKKRLEAKKAELNAYTLSVDQRKAAIESVTQAELSSIAKIEAARKNTEFFDRLIAGIQNLEGAFEGLGSGISSTVKAFVDANKSQKQYANNIATLQSDLMSTKEGSEEYGIIEKKLAKERSLQARDEISSYGKIAGSAKSLFKEKSAGYKILAGIEKTMHITRLAMDVAEMVSDATKTSSSVANSATRSGASIIEAGIDAVAAVIKAIASMPFPLNLVAGAATAAVVGGLISQLGESGPSVEASSAGFTAEDRQQTQGTGMSWVNGSQVENGGGVFGDPTAKLDSINKGIELLNDNTIESLYYDNRLVKAMEAVAQSMTGVATALFAIPGVTSGLNFGTQSGSWAEGGGIINSIFGGSSSTTKAIEDVGVQLSGSLETLIAQQFKDIVTTVTEDGGWFGSDSTYTMRNREVQALGSDINTAFVDIFKGAKDLFTQIGGLAGISAQTVTDIFRTTTVNLDISLKGLSGTEALEQINAVISSQLDVVSKKLFASFDQFRKFGEGYTDTVIRVVDGNMKVSAAVDAMGLATEQLKGDFEATERVINNMAGSLEKFTEQAKYFIDNFLSESERMQLVREGVQTALADMALPLELTRDQFKQLVQMQDLTTEAGRIMYQGLMNIQEGFFNMTQRLEDLKLESRDLEIELLKAAGNTEAATAALDAIATEGMTATELATYNYNKALQESIDALEEAKRVEEEKASLEQKMAQLIGDTVALRALELEKLDETNREIQMSIWAVETYTKAISTATAGIETATQNIAQAEAAIEGIQAKATDAYIAASDKVAQAQANIADLAVEAAKKMQEFGKTLREFISTELGGNNTQQNAMLEFSRNIGASLTGDTSAIAKVPELARAAIDAAKATATSSEQFNSERAAILAQVAKVATYTEQQAALTAIPTTDDPLVAANKALEAAILEQTKALEVATTIGANLVKTPEDIVAQFNQATQDLADALVDKTELELARAASQAALDALVTNTSALITAISGSTDETKYLGELVALQTDTLDTNLDGKLTYNELKLGLAGKATDAEIKALITAVDLNKDSVIDAYELESFNSTKSIVEALGEGFSLIDTNLDGKVSEAEFIKAMTGKASDSVLKTIFNLIDGDNDKIITATETSAAKSIVLATDISGIKTSTTNTANNVATATNSIDAGSAITAAGAAKTTSAVNTLNDANLLTLTNNSATQIQALNKLLIGNDDLFKAINSVAVSTAALANAVKPGSGGAAVSKTASANTLLSVFGKAVDAAGTVVELAGGIIDSAGNFVSNTVNKVTNWVSSWFSDQRTKKDISYAGTLANGISLYDFTYKAPYSQMYGADRKRGVIAQEVMGDYPEAVRTAKNGMYMVDYSKLPVPLELLKFASGGVFSNSVVTRPTAFNLGLMGEAGPEAVMPLSRTSGGKLGVVAQTSPADTVTRQMLKQNAELVAEVKQLREEVSNLRHEAVATAVATNKTTRILERVTQNGDSLLVTDTATV